MKETLVLLILIFQIFSAQALELKYISHVDIPYKMTFEKTSIGGLSGLYFESSDSTVYAVSDDRGGVNEPRFYQFSLSLKNDKLLIHPRKVTFLKVGDSEFSHSSKKFSPTQFSKVFDMEGIAKLPWGDFLISSEGDLDKKPRVLPQIFSVNGEGVIQKEYEIPDRFMPELQGKQTKGLRNNLAFEGLAGSPDGAHWLAGSESNLMQDPSDFVRWIEYEMIGAWVVKPVRQFKYPLVRDDSNEIIQFHKGVSEVSYLDPKRVLVLERYVRVGSNGMDFSGKIYITQLDDKKDSNEPVLLKKTLVLDMTSLKEKLGSLSNFEGMTLGPTLPNGHKTLILVSDDNFNKDMKTQFVIFEVRE